MVEAPQFGALVLATATNDKDGNGQSATVPAANKLLESLLCLCPTGEFTSRNAVHQEAMTLLLRHFDSVRDRGLWALLQQLLGCSLCEVSPVQASSLHSAGFKDLLGELDRLLRLHQLTGIV